MTRTEPATACYQADFGCHRLVSESSVDCPAEAAPVTPPPAAPVEVPGTCEGFLRKMLAALPDRPTVDRVNDASTAACRACSPPVGVDGLFGCRDGKDVRVRRPSWAEAQPGELTSAAKSRHGTTPPHRTSGLVHHAPADDGHRDSEVLDRARLGGQGVGVEDDEVG